MNIESLKVSLSIKNRILENLHIVKLLQDNDLKETIESITGKKLTNPTEFFKYRILNFIKNTKYINKLIEEDNQTFINIVKDENNLEIRDILLESLIKEIKYNEDVLKIENKDDLLKILNLIKSDKISELKLINPFSQIETLLSVYTGKDTDESLFIKNITKINKKELEESYRVSFNKSIEERVYFNIFDNETEKSLVTQFVLFHELAHGSYYQMLEDSEVDANKKEINADLVSVLKIIKTHDFNLEDSSKICNLILRHRSKLATYKERYDGSGYMAGSPKSRTHFTEEAILNLKIFLLTEGNLNYIKNIKDNEIGTFSEIFYYNSIESNKYTNKNFDTNEQSLIIETILNNPEFFKTMKEDYNDSYIAGIARFSSNSFNTIKKHYVVTQEYIEKINRNIIKLANYNKSIFNDICITYQLRTNFENFINKVENMPVDENIFNTIKTKFEEYKLNKDSLNIDINKKTTSRELVKKIKNN